MVPPAVPNESQAAAEILADLAPADRDLIQIIEAWPTLAAPFRAAIMAIVESVIGWTPRSHKRKRGYGAIPSRVRAP